MKVYITMKFPDGISDGIQRAAEESVAELEGLSDDEREELVDGRIAQIGEKLERWIEYGDYIRIEFDTDAMTATVVENR